MSLRWVLGPSSVKAPIKCASNNTLSGGKHSCETCCRSRILSFIYKLQGAREGSKFIFSDCSLMSHELQRFVCNQSIGGVAKEFSIVIIRRASPEPTCEALPLSIHKRNRVLLDDFILALGPTVNLAVPGYAMTGCPALCSAPLVDAAYL